MSAIAILDVVDLARALGVYGADVTPLYAVDGDGYRWSVRPKDGASVNTDTVSVALILLGHARGLRLDLGECRECEGECEVATGVERGGTHELLNCPACTVDGKPTGRESIDLTTALARAWPQCPVRQCDAGRVPHPHGILSAWACRRCKGRGNVPGDTDERDGLMVLADQLQVDGDALGVWLTAWLLDDVWDHRAAIGEAVRAEADRRTPAEPMSGHAVANEVSYG